MSDVLRLMSYNRSWPQEFEQAKSSILQATEGWITVCEHFGATSLTGSLGRPTIDLLAGMDDLAGLNPAAFLIEGLNYRRLPSPGWCEDELVAYLEKPRSGQATHTVLLANRNSAVFQRALRIRDHLRNNQVDREALENLKKDHYTASCDAAQRYAAVKHAFLDELDRRLGSAA